MITQTGTTEMNVSLGFNMQLNSVLLKSLFCMFHIALPNPTLRLGVQEKLNRNRLVQRRIRLEQKLARLIFVHTGFVKDFEKGY